jgi:teichoic acid transport system permease protein
MAINDHRAQHKRLLLGALWHLLDPVLRIGIYWVIFGLLLAGRRPEGFLAYLTIGIFLYRFVQASVSQGSTSIDQPSGGLRELGLPRLLLPASVVTRNVLKLGTDVVVILVVVAAVTQRVTLGWLAFVLVLLPITVLLAFGAALVFARLGVAIRDITRVLPHLFRLGFWASGVILPVTILTDAYPALEPFLKFNPLYAVLTVARHLLITPVEGTFALWVSAIAWAFGLTFVGLVLSFRLEGRSGDA